MTHGAFAWLSARIVSRALGSVVVLSLLIADAPLRAQASVGVADTLSKKSRPPRWSLEVMGGSAVNMPTPLVVRQQGFPEIRMTAHYATKPLGPYAPYYAVRLRVEIRQQPWELELVHHRLFLTNTTSEISRFDVHYGYNYILLGRAWRLHNILLHAAAGPILPNADNIVRRRRWHWEQHRVLDVGYRLSGVGAALTMSREVKFASHALLVFDGGVIFGQATVPVANGSARVPNVGLHGRIGVAVF